MARGNFLMPGTLFHFIFADMVRDRLKQEKLITDDIEFYCGNLIPDMAIPKGRAHYEKMTEIEGVYSPNIETVKEIYLTADNVSMGIYTHLFLDNFFIERGLLRWLKFYPEDNLVCKRSNPGKLYTYEEVFSKRGIYGDYTKMNPLILDCGLVTISTIESIPEILPLTGIEEMDRRKEKTWKQELYGFFIEEVDNYGILEYEKILNLLEAAKREFFFTTKKLPKH